MLGEAQGVSGELGLVISFAASLASLLLLVSIGWWWLRHGRSGG